MVRLGYFDNLKTGDLLLCSGTGFFARMIQAATESEWSHVGVLIRVEAIERVMVLESLEPVGVRCVPLEKYLEDYDGRGNPYPGRICIGRHSEFGTKATPEALRNFARFGVDQLGYPYDTQMIAKIAARIMISRAVLNPDRRDLESRWSQRGLERDKDYICSELAWECYQSLGLDVTHDPRTFIAPADFANDERVDIFCTLR